MDEKKSQHLVSESGEIGPRLDVVLRMFDRSAEFEEEVRSGRRKVKGDYPWLKPVEGEVVVAEVVS